MTCLLDTNVLIYAADEDEPERMEQANNVLLHLIAKRQAVVSAQVLAEFANVSLRQIRRRSAITEINGQLELYSRVLVVLPITPAIVLEAVRGVRDHQLAYYDAQIWAAARLNQVPCVLSEDFNAGSTLEGVAFINPFAAGFDLDSL